ISGGQSIHVVGNSVIGSGTKGKEGLCASWHSDAPVAMIVIEWRLADRPRSCLHSTRFGRKCGQRYGLTKENDHPFLSGSPVKFCSARRTKVDPKVRNVEMAFGYRFSVSFSFLISYPFSESPWYFQYHRRISLGSWIKGRKGVC
ncbi:hypothetical protein V1478_009416, partial [Vespula squamosa]